MKLNTSIIYEQLKQKYSVKLYGGGTPKMVYSSPELYIDNTFRFLSDRIYLATVEHLPSRPVIEKRVLLVCIGDSPRLNYYKEQASVILIQEHVDFFEVYKTLQEIFETYFEWESRILDLFMHSPTIQDILVCSYPIFRRPLFVLNASFQYAASMLPPESSYQNSHWIPSAGSLNSESFLSFLKEKDVSMDAHGAFRWEFEECTVLCVNLFDSSNTYIGCLCCDEAGIPFFNGEEKLMEYLAGMIERISEISPVLLNNEHRSLKKILQNMMGEKILSQNEKLLLRSSNHKQNYLCASIHCLKQLSRIPIDYVCSVLENLFDGSIFFEQNNTILGLIPASLLTAENASYREIKKQLDTLIDELILCAGFSNPFTDLYSLRTYYLQAEAAIDNGHIYHPEQSIYYFSDYALTEMIINAFGAFPIESYFPDGFRKLIEHDKSSDVSYLATLDVFLEENMSYSKAAGRLFIHRSTLLERIERIKQELSADLKNPAERLKLQIILKALLIEKEIKK